MRAARAHRPHRRGRRAAEAIVYDYKGRNAVESASWRKKRKYQIALYILAARDVLGLEPIGGLYQPLGGKDQRAARARARATPTPGLRHGRRPTATRRDGFDAIVDGVAARTCAPRSPSCAPARSSRARTRCAYDGGCAYPTICRCEAA